MLWLYLLGAVTALIIVLRRVLRRQKPLSDELYSTRVAIKHVHSGVAWVQQNGLIGFANESLAELTGVRADDLAKRDWYSLFPATEHERVREAHTQMLLAGIASLDTKIERGGGRTDSVNLRLVAVHDHKLRLVGHHVLIHDLSRQRALEDQLHQLSRAVGQNEPVAAPEPTGNRS
jgi:PAS domain S-box-containing protein